MNPILSVCIPTYNRDKYLDKTIESIVKQKRFQETMDVEIVISDNCSEDYTYQIVEKYKNNYGEKIKYYKNDFNIQAKFNIEKALSHGRGSFLKLNNDSLIHIDGSLDLLIDTIMNNIAKKDILFFSNGILKNRNMILNNLNSFVSEVSFYSTWIVCFGIWKDDFDTITDFNKHANLLLPHTSVLFSLITERKNIFINNDRIFIPLETGTKGGYDLVVVFLDNYFTILIEYVERGVLKYDTMKIEKRKVLLKFLMRWLINCKTKPKQYYFTYLNYQAKIFYHFQNDKIILYIFWILFYVKLSIYFIYTKLKRAKLSLLY